MYRGAHSPKIQSHSSQTRLKIMNHEQIQLDLEPSIIILGIGYATSFLALIGWGATL